VALGALWAIAAAALASAANLEPAAVVVPAASAAAVAIVFVRHPAAGLGAFLLVVLIVHTLEQWLGADLRFFDEISVALLVPLSAAKSWPRLVKLRPGWKEAALAVALAAGVASSLVNAVPAETWMPALALLMKGFAFFYAVSWLRLWPSEIEGVGAVILAASALILALGFAELLNPVVFQQAVGLPPFHEVRGSIAVVKSVFLHPALFGWFTAFASLFLYARFIVLREWWALAAGLILSLGTLLSGRRRPVIGVLTALGAGAVWIWRRRSAPKVMVRLLAPLAFALLVIGIVASPVLSDFYAGTVDEYLGRGDLGEILSPHPDETVIAGSHPRMALYVGSFAIARDFLPLGAGLGRFGSYMSEAHYSPIYDRYGLDVVFGLSPEHPEAISDTFWPMVLGELGPVGLVGLAVFLGNVLVRLWRASTDMISLPLRAFALGGLFVFVEGLVGSLTAATYVAPPIAYYVFAAAGAVMAAGRLVGSGPGLSISPDRLHGLLEVDHRPPSGELHQQTRIANNAGYVYRPET
jgi:hypothetical protein